MSLIAILSRLRVLRQPALIGRVARAFAFHSIGSVSRSNTTPACPLGVYLLNLGALSLMLFQGRGFWFDFLCPTCRMQLRRKSHNQEPHLSRSVTDGGPEIQSQSPGHPPPSDTCRNVECNADIREVKSSLAGQRFHDLRHYAITELAESQASDQTITAIAGHVSPKMLVHYSHVRVAANARLWIL